MQTTSGNSAHFTRIIFRLSNKWKEKGAFHWLSPVSDRPPHFPLIADEMGKKGRHSMGSERVGGVNEKKVKHSCMPDLPLSYTSKSS